MATLLLTPLVVCLSLVPFLLGGTKKLRMSAPTDPSTFDPKIPNKNIVTKYT